MSAEAADIDRIVDYRSEYSVIKKAKVTGDQMIGLCPFHDDSNNSFSVNLKTGQWHCFAEDRGGNFLDFYAELNGCDTKEAYRQIMEKYGVSAEDQKRNQEQERNYSLAQYAFEKRLPEEWLKQECFLSTAKERSGATYMKIPYLDENRRESTYRKRFARKDFRWKYGSSGKIGLYGEWRLPNIRSVGYAVMVEGESDSQSLWYMGISALGVPGASMFKPHQAAMLQDLKIYLHHEPDQGGETFVRKMLAGLREGSIIREGYKSCRSMVEGCEDRSQVYV